MGEDRVSAFSVHPY